MTVSYDTVEAIYAVLHKHCTDEQVELIVTDLLKVPGNQSFRETVKRLAARDATVKPKPRK